MDREELLILLDNYRQTLKNLEGLEDYESEAIILANIVKAMCSIGKINK